MSSRFSPTRRTMLGLMGTGLAAASGWSFGKITASEPHADVTLQAIRLNHPIQSGISTRDMMGFAADGPPPVLRMRQNQPFNADIINHLDEPTTVHWHGLRIPNGQDGVPYLTQFPVMPGERHRYSFTPPDAGTYWYHPHCNTLEQMARGMTGVIVVEEEKNPGFDDELVLNLRDFRLGKDGQFIATSKPRQAARGGTLGTVRTANWQVQPQYDKPAGSLIRLRLVASDVTRTYTLGLTGARARLIALDGNPLPSATQQRELGKEQFVIGAGQRADLAVQMPVKEGQTVQLEAQIGQRKIVLSTIRAVGNSSARRLEEIALLPPNPVPQPDLKNAEVMPFTFGWAVGDPPVGSVCGSLGNTFWAINREPWPGDVPDNTGPLAVLKQGKSYIFRLRNETRYRHPIHLHGMTFKLLHSNKRKLAPLWTDTALMIADETMEVALVADNPGNWVFHCHVIEHQKTGLAGYVRVE